MKKLLGLATLLLLAVALVGCGSATTTTTNPNHVDELNVYFVPSRPADEILTITAPLAAALKSMLAIEGFDVGQVNIMVSSTYEAAGQALYSGTADIAYLPGGTYVEYKDKTDSPVEVILAATRGGLNNDSTNPVDWNNNKPTTSDPTNQVAYYKGLIVAGTTTAARTVADKVNAGGTLVWNDVKDLTWCIQSSTSSSGYIYPDIWLEDNFGKTYDDLTHATVNPGGYGGAIADLASGTCDVATMYADARRDYADDWTGTYGMSDSIWNMTDVIGVTKNIMNDTISVSTVNLTADQITDIQQAYLALAQLQVGKDIEAVYSHEGYVIVTDSDYDGARQAAALTAGQ